MDNMKINTHGLITIAVIIVILIFTIIKVQISEQGDIPNLLYSAIAVIAYAFFIFTNIREREALLEDKRRIVSDKQKFEIFRTLVGWHLTAVLAILGLLIPFNSFLSLLWLVAAVIAGLGIPRIVLQQPD